MEWSCRAIKNLLIFTEWDHVGAMFRPYEGHVLVIFYIYRAGVYFSVFLFYHAAFSTILNPCIAFEVLL